MLGNEQELKDEILKFKGTISEKNKSLEEKKKQEEQLSEKFKKLISERDELQKNVRDNQIVVSQHQNKTYGIEQEINNLKIEDAKFNAEAENLRLEMNEFEGIERDKSS